MKVVKKVKNNIQIKTYDIDYSFIIKNYLDKSLWHKEWTLLVYKDFIFTITLERIDIYDETLAFQIKLKYVKNKTNYNITTSIWHNLGNSNITVLKRQINGAIEGLIKSVEDNFIRATDEYYRAEQLEDLEREKLEDYANEFLNSEGVSNSEIRDAYVEYYISKNSNFDYKNRIIDEYRYIKLFDLYLTFYQIKKDEDNIKKIEDKYKTKYDNNSLEQIKKEIEENLQYIETEEYEEEMKNNLESL